MTDQSNREWKRETVLRKVAALRDEYITEGRPYTERKLAETCCIYGGVTPEQVLKWMKGEL